jgi:photosystem II stability/assembly factor-like uncharacterized protein
MKRYLAFATPLCILLFVYSIATSQTRTWQQVTGNWSGAALDIEAAPNGDLYALTNGDEVSTTFRLFKSVDHAQTWQAVTSAPRTVGDAGWISASPRGEIYVGTYSSQCHVAIDTNAHLYRSLDNGLTWDSILTRKAIAGLQFFNSQIYVLEANNGSTVDGSGLLYCTENWGSLRGLALPSNAGYVRQMVTFGNQAVIVANLPFLYSAGQQPTPLNINTLQQSLYSTVAKLSSSSALYMDQYGSFRSDDLQSWKPDSSFPNLPYTAYYIRPRLVIDPSGICVAIDQEYNDSVFVSQDNGRHWLRQSDLLNLPAYSAQNCICRDSSGAVVIGKDYGVFKSTDGAKTWQKSVIPTVEIASIASPQVGTLMVKPAYAPLFYFTTNNGSDWQQTALPDSLYRADVFFAQSPSNQVISTEYGNYYVGPCRLFEFNAMTDSWTQLTPLYPQEGLTFSEADPKGNIYLGNFYVSHDAGISWDKSPYPGTVPWAGFAASPDGYVFEGSEEPVVYRSSDAGRSWSTFYMGEMLTTFIAFLAPGNGLVLGATDKHQILRSTDNGETWKPWGTGFSDSACAMALTDRGEVFVAGENGLHYCNLADSVWRDADLGLANKSVNTVVTHGNNVYVGTEADGMYESDGAPSSVISSNAPVSQDIRIQSSPDPFVGHTNISVELPTADNVVLVVYDALGRKCTTLVDGNLTQGMHHFSFESDAPSAGFYFAELQTSGGTSRLKMVSVGK